MTDDIVKDYRGRFAPSPTGALHFGSLVAAIGSYLDARKNNGAWLVRMEDIDPPREVAGAADDILKTLELFGFEWDEPVMYQSRRHDIYNDAIESLSEKEFVYACTCSRKEISSAGKPGLEGTIYPGTCRYAGNKFNKEHAVRVITPKLRLTFEDRLQGLKTCNLHDEIGDFVLRRRDGLFAYQLAVVVDDAEQNITDIVRGSDLLLSTFRQIHLQSMLGIDRVDYCHLPIAVNEKGEKLSKQTSAPPLDKKNPVSELVRAMMFLGYKVPKAVSKGDLDQFWTWALKTWDLRKLVKNEAIAC